MEMGVPRFRISLNHSPNRRTIRLSADEESGARFLPATSNVTDILIKPARVEGRRGRGIKGAGMIYEATMFAPVEVSLPSTRTFSANCSDQFSGALEFFFPVSRASSLFQ